MIPPAGSTQGGSRTGGRPRRDAAPVCFIAPGAGLGHLVRVCAVAMELTKLGVPSRIMTHSVHARMVRAVTGCEMDRIPARDWRQRIPRVLANARPRLAVVDTFPWGIRGEWAEGGPWPCRFVLLARRLNVPAYLQASRLTWNAASPLLRHVIACEPLGRGYRELLEASGSELHTLPGRIRLPWEECSFQAPTRLLMELGRKRTWLVVHSGPPEEIGQLIELARSDMAGEPEGQIIAVVPREGAPPAWETRRVFPAACLMPHAYRLVTGAGYNCIAETGPFRDIHRCLPFPRRYDQQAARLREVPAGASSQSENAASAAARSIASLL